MSNLPKSYTVWRFEEKDGPLKKATVEWKDPAPGELVVKVLACGVCGSDEHIPQQSFPTGFPRVPGHEIIGDVVAVGAGERIFKVGDRVGSGWHGGHCGRCNNCAAGDVQQCDTEEVNGIFRDGGYAEYANLRVEAVLHVPRDMDPAEAAPLLCAGVTTFNSLRNMDTRAGDIVAVQGIGGLGHLALQYANALGYRTIALSSGSSKKDLATKLGATEYLDGSKIDQAQALQALGGAKVIMCTAPSSKVIQGLVPGLAVGGQLLILAVLLENAEINLGSLIVKKQSIRGWPSGTAKDSADCIEFSRRTGVKCMVEKFAFEDAPKAFEHRASARFRAVIVL